MEKNETVKEATFIEWNFDLFLTAMIFANIGGSMYDGLLPLYLKELDADITDIGLFFTLAMIVPLFLQILGGWVSDSLGRLRAIAIGSVFGVLDTFRFCWRIPGNGFCWQLRWARWRVHW